MPRRARKIFGTALLIVLVPLYALVIAAAGGGRMTDKPVPLQVLFFGFFGLAWVLPAGLILRWMIGAKRPAER